MFEYVAWFLPPSIGQTGRVDLVGVQRDAAAQHLGSFSSFLQPAGMARCASQLEFLHMLPIFTNDLHNISQLHFFFFLLATHTHN